jgi:hypothetical protein
MADETTVVPLSTAEADAITAERAQLKLEYEADYQDLLKQLANYRERIYQKRNLIKTKFFLSANSRQQTSDEEDSGRYPPNVRLYEVAFGNAFKPGNGGWIVNYARGATQAIDESLDYSFYANANWIIPETDRELTAQHNETTDINYSEFGKGYTAQAVINGNVRPNLEAITIFICDEFASTLSAPNLRYFPGAAGEFKALDRLILSYNKTWDDLQKRKATYNLAATANAASLSLTNTDGTLNQTAIAGYTYNVGSVAEAYFSPRTSWKTLFDKFGASGTNSPVTVGQASQLWETSKTNKGMIQLWTQQIQNGNTPILSTPGTTAPGSPQAYDINKTLGPRGFQFHYNPASVDMQYSGMAGVDANFEASGLDKFNMLGVPAGTTSTVSFSILVNRVFDLQHYDEATGKLTGDGADKCARVGRCPYSPRHPLAWEQEDIYNRGTMYDVEALLRVLVGWTIKPYMGARASKEDGETADMGFLIGRPIELHLGKSLRYVGYIGSISVNHVLFDERMVPLFTNIGFAFNRIPDYANPVPPQAEQVARALWTEEQRDAFRSENR